MKKLTYIDDNLLLNQTAEVCLHSCNCQNVFGSGIARSIREMYPEAYRADCIAAKNRANKLGNFSVGEISEATRKRHGTNIQRIYNLYGQNLGTDYNELGSRKTNYEALYTAMEKVAKILRSATEGDKQVFDFNREPVVGIPYLMGCGLGKGNWSIVERLIEVAFDGYEADVLIVRLEQ